MPRHDELVYLRHMRDFAGDAVQFCQGSTRSDLDTDRMPCWRFADSEMTGESACQLLGACLRSN